MNNHFARSGVPKKKAKARKRRRLIYVVHSRGRYDSYKEVYGVVIAHNSHTVNKIVDRLNEQGEGDIYYGYRGPVKVLR